MNESTPLAMISIAMRSSLLALMQASLVRVVAFDRFDRHTELFASHPANGSLVWKSLEALEEVCVVRLVEHLRKRRWAKYVPPSVTAAVKRLGGHRNIISHPGHRAGDWSDPTMRQFEEEGRRFEARAPLVWSLQRALNAELAAQQQAPIADFVITAEMVTMLRLIWMGSLKPEHVSAIPDDGALLRVLEASRISLVRQFQEREGGTPIEPRPGPTDGTKAG